MPEKIKWIFIKNLTLQNPALNLKKRKGIRYNGKVSVILSHKTLKPMESSPN